MDAEEHVENGGNCENSDKPLKRKYEPSVLDNFTKLSNGQEKTRIKSSCNLLKHLSEDEHAEKGQEELKYALGRLIRGLGASKVQTRTGFFTTLVGLLNLTDTNINHVFEIVEKELHKGNNSKSENADISLGRILVAGAIIRSNLYDNMSEDEKKKVLEMLIAAGKERFYLGLAANSFLVELYKKISSKEFEQVVFHVIMSEAFKPFPEQNLDSLYLLLSTLDHFPDSINLKFLKKTLGSVEVVSRENLSELADILTTVLKVTALNHPVYDIFIERIVKSDLLVEFFEALDKTISKSNRNKYLVVTKLLTGVLQKLENPSKIPDLLTKNFLQQMINTFKTATGKNKDKDFQDATQKLFEALLTSLKNESVKHKTKIKVLKKLLFYPGTFIFEKVTRSKLIQNVTSTLNMDGVKKLGEIYRDVILATTDRVVNENVTEKWWNNDRVYASHLLVKLLNHPAMVDNDWKIEQMKFLMRLALMKGQSDNIGHELGDALKETFYSSLDLKLSKLEDLRYILSHLVTELNGTMAENSGEIFRHPLSEDDLVIWQQTVQLSSKDQTKKKKVVFQILFLHLGLQLFSNNTKLASESLTELFSCYERVKKSKKIENDSSDDPLWIEVVVDLFLNLLSHNSHLLRNIINCVFPHLCKYMNATAIHQILSVLDPKSESNPLSKYVEESSDDEEEVENEEDDDKSSEESEDDEDVDDEEETVNDKFRMALHQALGANAGSDTESIDLDQLDDEEGEKLDEAIAQAFKQFKPNLGRKKKQSKDEETLTHFRVRVLDLIEIYLSSNPSMMLTLEIMLPLLQTLEFSIRDDHQTPLQNRVRACLKKLASLKKFEDFDGVTEQVLVDLLKSLLEKGTKNAIIIQDMGEKIAECCIFVINCSEYLKNGETSKKKKQGAAISEVIKDSLETFFKKRDCLTPYVLFKNIVQLNWEGILSLFPLLTGFVFTTTIRPFRRSQAIELLRLFYSNHRFHNAHPEQLKSLDQENFLMDCLGFFRTFCENPEENKVREKFIGGLFGLLATIKTSNIANEFQGWSQIGEMARQCRSNVVLSRDSKTAFRKLCNSLSISHIVEVKRNIKLNNDDESVTEPDSKKPQNEKKKTRKLNKEALKLKKESKILRLESMSEGLGKRKLGSLGDEVEDNNDDESVSQPDKKKSKSEEKKREKRKSSSLEDQPMGENGEVNNKEDDESIGEADNKKSKNEKKKKRKSSSSGNQLMEEVGDSKDEISDKTNGDKVSKKNRIKKRKVV